MEIRSYSWNIFEIALPARSEVESLPQTRQNPSGPLRWRVEWARVADGNLSPQLHAQLERGELSLGETTDFQNQLRELLGALSAGALLAVPQAHR